MTSIDAINRSTQYLHIRPSPNTLSIFPMRRNQHFTCRAIFMRAIFGFSKLYYCHYSPLCSVRVFFSSSPSAHRMNECMNFQVVGRNRLRQPHTARERKRFLQFCKAMPNAPIKYLCKQFQNNSAKYDWPNGREMRAENKNKIVVV